MYNNLNYMAPIQSMIPQVHGREGAEAFRLGINSSVFLVDGTEDNTVWVKTTDSAGFATLRKARLEFVEDKQPVAPTDYVSKTDFDDLKTKVEKLLEELDG